MAEHLDVLISAEDIQAKIAEIAAQLDAKYPDGSILIGVLKGSIHLLSDLARFMQTDTCLEFMQVSSYHGGKSTTGVVQIRKDLDTNIEGKDVVIVEDIIDTGVTLNHLRNLLETRSPKSLTIVTLLSKPEARKIEIPVDHIGFEIPDAFVVGYGLDYAERFRNLPYIAILRDE